MENSRVEPKDCARGGENLNLKALLDVEQTSLNSGIAVDGYNLARALENLGLIKGMDQHLKTGGIFTLNSFTKVNKWRRVLFGLPTKKVDVAIYQQIPYLSFFAGRQFDSLRIFRVHDLFPMTHPKHYSTRERISFRLRLASLNKDVYLLANSESTHQSVINNKFEYKAIATLNCLTPSYGYRIINQEKCGNCYCSKEISNKFVLNVSAFVPRKNHFGMIDDWERLIAPHGVDLYCVGATLRKKIHSKIFELSERTTSLGQLKILPEQCPFGIDSLYKRSSGYLSYSFAEGFNMPLHDALYNGVASLVAFEKPNVSKNHLNLLYQRDSDLEPFLKLVIESPGHQRLTSPMNEAKINSQLESFESELRGIILGVVETKGPNRREDHKKD